MIKLKLLHGFFHERLEARRWKSFCGICQRNIYIFYL